MLEKMINGINPDYNVLVYNSRTPEIVRNLHFSDPDKYMIGDVLIYTPTITAGISIEIVHYDNMYCIFEDQSCNADQCIQMIGRVR